ncbi:MAG: hypothetical protein ACI4EI_05835 [Muricoprocola sp.]
MKTKRTVMIILFLLLVFGTAAASPAPGAEAAALTNVMKAPTAKEGNWVISAKGYRYKYKANGQYAKSCWLKIGGNIYYFKSNGYLQTGWKTYNGRRYHFDGQGALVTGWKEISGKKYYFWKDKKELSGSAAVGKVVIASHYYYFDASGAMQTGWIRIGNHDYYFKPSNGSMAVNTTVGKYKVDKDGKRITSSSTDITDVPSNIAIDNQEKTGKVDCWVGDSRTVGMAIAKGNSIAGDTIMTAKWIAKTGAGYSWYKSTAEARVKALLKKKPTMTIVFNFGVNDLANIDNYIAAYQKLMEEYPKAHIYIMSVNPTDSAKYHGYATNTAIKSFNKKMKAAFPNHYINTFSYITKKGFESNDGLHYLASTYKLIYDYVLTKV